MTTMSLLFCRKPFMGSPVIAASMTLQAIFIRHNSTHIGDCRMRSSHRMDQQFLHSCHLGAKSTDHTGARMADDAILMMTARSRSIIAITKRFHFMTGQTKLPFFLKKVSPQRQAPTKDQKHQADKSPLQNHLTFSQLNLPQENSMVFTKGVSPKEVFWTNATSHRRPMLLQQPTQEKAHSSHRESGGFFCESDHR